MTKKFIPFHEFQGLAKSKTLHESMGENCNDRLAPEEPTPCDAKPCPPWWQPTGDLRCLKNGLIDREEADGCGNTRWVRTAEEVIWVDEGESPCGNNYDPDEPILRVERNQCGDTRTFDTGRKCCTPEWVDGKFILCTSSYVTREQYNSCTGASRWKQTNEPVIWERTGETRCLPGDIFKQEEVNQCGNYRWVYIGPCPCVPNWVTTGVTRCTGTNIENQESDGCGGTRWVDSDTAVTWAATGNTRCNDAQNLIQNEEVNQCGTTRWVNTATPCTVEPPPPPPPEVSFGTLMGEGCYTVSQGRQVQYFIGFGADGKLTEGSSLALATLGNAGTWCTNPADVGLFEIKLSGTADDMAANTWYSLPRSLVWTQDGDGEMSSNRFLNHMITIRRKTDGVPVATKQLQNIQLGVGVECV